MPPRPKSPLPPCSVSASSTLSGLSGVSCSSSRASLPSIGEDAPLAVSDLRPGTRAAVDLDLLRCASHLISGPPVPPAAYAPPVPPHGTPSPTDTPDPFFGACNAPPSRPQTAPRHAQHPGTSPAHTRPPAAAAALPATDPTGLLDAVASAESIHSQQVHASHFGFGHLATAQRGPLPHAPGALPAHVGAGPPSSPGPGSSSSDYIVSDELLQVERGLMLPGWTGAAREREGSIGGALKDGVWCDVHKREGPGSAACSPYQYQTPDAPVGAGPADSADGASRALVAPGADGPAPPPADEDLGEVSSEDCYIVSAKHFCTDADGFIIHAEEPPAEPLVPPPAPLAQPAAKPGDRHQDAAACVAVHAA